MPDLLPTQQIQLSQAHVYNTVFSMGYYLANSKYGTYQDYEPNKKALGMLADALISRTRK